MLMLLKLYILTVYNFKMYNHGKCSTYVFDKYCNKSLFLVLQKENVVKI